ncbi:DUF4430 domain-containing protein [Clostridium sp. JNZ X4-2]
MKSKKKKYAVIISAVVVCVVVFAFAIKAQKIYTSTTTNKQMSAENTQGKSKDVYKSDKSESEAKNGSQTSAASGKAAAASDSNSSNTTSKGNSQAGQAVSSQSGSAQTSGTNGTSSQKPAEQSSIEIIDAIHGNTVVLQKNLDNIDGQTVGYITQKALDEAKINYTTKGTGSTVYFSDINGLKEKAEGPLSGWCYYVKKKGQSEFSKASVGSGQYVLNSGDAVIWKYVENGYSN